MASYNILIKRSAQKEIQAIGSKKDRQRIIKRIQDLARDPKPAGSEKLSGSPYFRIRQGSYRVVYEIQDDVLIVHILKVGHRKGIYR